VRVVIADDSALIREGIARLLGEVGIEVLDTVPDGDALVASVARHRPDVVVVDIRMPPSFMHEGARAALELRASYRSWGSCSCRSPSRPGTSPTWSAPTRAASATCSRTG